MKRTLKKLGGLLLALCMVLSLLPATALAAKPPSGDGWKIDVNNVLTIDTQTGMADWYTAAFNNSSYAALVERVVIADGVDAIIDNAFQSCTNLESITLPDSLLTIGKLSFSNCTSLKSIALPDSLQTISDAAFTACGLTSVTIPASVTAIGDGAFATCTSIKNAVFLSGDPSKLTIGSNIFTGSDALNGVYVPAAALSEYKTTFSAYESLFHAPNVAITKSGTTTYYPSLSDALEKAENGDTITLLDNITEEASNAKATAGITVTIDGGGKTLTGKDSTTESVALTLIGTGTVILKDLKLQGGTTSGFGVSTGLKTGGLISVQSNNVTVMGGTATMSYGLDNWSAGTVDVTAASATVTGMGVGVANEGPGTVNVGTATGKGSQGIGAYNVGAGTINVTTADGDLSGVRNDLSGTVNVTTAIGKSYGVFNVKTGTVNVTTVIGYQYGVSNEAGGTVNATEVKATALGGGGVAVKNDAGGKVNVKTITSGTFTTTTNMSVAAVTLHTGTGASCVLDSITVAKTGDTTVGTLPSVVIGGTYSNTWYTDSAKTQAFSDTSVTGATTLYSSFYTVPVPVIPPTGGGGGGSVATTPTATVTGSTATTIVPGTTSGGVQTVPVPGDTMTSLTDAAKKVESGGSTAIAVIDTGSGSGLTSVSVTVPGTQFDAFASGTSASLQFKSGLGTVTFSSGAVDAIDAAGSGDVAFSMGTVSASSLSATQQAAVGSRPVYSFSVTVGGTAVSQFGSSVTVSLPYTLGANEDPNAIVIYYLDASGALQAMQGKYDAATKSVTFTTNHFSDYVIGYNKVSFADVSATAWYADAVTFLAARGITSGTTATNFSPDATLTRGQFVTMLLRAYGISPDTSTTDNFADAGDTYYTNYLAAAKRLGITSGVGDNMFAPDKTITRQEMFTLLYNALKVLNQLPSGTSGKATADFSDASEIASWAKDAMTLLVKTGTVSGSDGKLSPTATTTRAEMAQVLYSLLGK